jgi:hypothetical protein
MAFTRHAPCIHSDEGAHQGNIVWDDGSEVHIDGLEVKDGSDMLEVNDSVLTG